MNVRCASVPAAVACVCLSLCCCWLLLLLMCFVACFCFALRGVAVCCGCCLVLLVMPVEIIDGCVLFGFVWCRLSLGIGVVRGQSSLCCVRRCRLLCAVDGCVMIVVVRWLLRFVAVVRRCC